jgi:signal transduction histidine kinase/ActR/RegA family two-component response regulator
MPEDHVHRTAGLAAQLERLSIPPVSYASTVVVVAAALALRVALSRAVGTGVTYLTFYPAVMIAAILCGLRPGILATVLSAICAAVWVIPAGGPILPMRPGGALGLAVFCGMGALMNLVAERSRQAHARAEAAEKALLVHRAEERFREAVTEAEAEQETVIELLRIVNQTEGTRETVRAAATFFQERSACEAVGVRLQEGDDYPYFEAHGFPARFVELENWLCARDGSGVVLRDGAGAAVVECMCGNVIRGRTDPAKPFFTVGGSFFSNDTTQLLATASDADRQGRTRNRCNAQGFQSVALVPLRAGGVTLGLLQLNDRRPGMFSPSKIALWERLAGYLAVGLAKCGADEALRAANRQLADADRRKTEFLAVLSHELRNPLTPIRNSLYVLERIPPGGEQARRAHDIIDRQVTHLTRLVGDLLDVTRITNGKVQLQRERLEVNELVRRTVEDHASMLAAAGLRLELEEHPEPIWVRGDRTRLAQVIGNLLQNATKFTPVGGQVTVAMDVQCVAALVRVRDTGPGIAPEVLPRLFEPFSQADMALDRSKGGLGLGLALVKGMVELHGGSVSGESNGVGQGATFTIRLPLDVLPAQPAVDRRGVEGGEARRRVLIIEDNVDGADSLREVLEMAGHRVEVAYSGAQGIEKAQAFVPEVILCDIGLPEMDGYEVARRLREDREVSGAHLIALTGYAQPEDVAKALEAGFDEHIAKPPDPGVLERAVGAPVRARVERTLSSGP